MVDQTLLEYVKNSLKQGVSSEIIKQSLISNGWSESMVNEALSVASMPQAPLAPGFVAAQPASVSKYSTGSTVQRRNYEIYSPLSVLLSFVLFFGLLIFANKIISDIGRHFGKDITGQLVFDALVILPFLIIAFALHYGLTERGEKYRILSSPYYIVSGWLLIRLLFKVSQYILSTQVVGGVYIVLILIVSVLTGVIFFVQKFLKHKD